MDLKKLSEDCPKDESKNDGYVKKECVISLIKIIYSVVYYSVVTNFVVF